MSSYDIRRTVEIKLEPLKHKLIQQKIEIKLSEPEAEALHEEIEKELGLQHSSNNCPLILAEIKRKSDDDLIALLEKIRKKRAIIAGVS